MVRPLDQDLLRFGQLATRSQLRELGYGPVELRRAVAAQEVWPIGRSWLAGRGAEPAALRAVALGGRLAASSALASYGIWVTAPSGLWIRVPRSASHVPPLAAGEHRLWAEDHFPSRGDPRWRVSVRDALVQHARVSCEADAVASFDGALNKRLLTASGLDDVFGVLPRRLRRLRGRVNGSADSGLETLFRLAAEAEGWRVEVQVRIFGVGRVDLLIDGWLVVELDGAAWHDDETSQERDRRRDAELILLGYRWHRFRASQVLGDMARCLAVIRTILASGRPAAVR